jgi:hypothetical protein
MSNPRKVPSARSLGTAVTVAGMALSGGALALRAIDRRGALVIDDRATACPERY